MPGMFRSASVVALISLLGGSSDRGARVSTCVSVCDEGGTVMSMTKRRGSVAMSVVCAALSVGVASPAYAAAGGGGGESAL